MYVLDLQAPKKKIAEFGLPYDNDTGYSVSCCGGYWELQKAKDGVTEVDLYWLDRAEPIATWTNDDQSRHEFTCHCSFGVLRKDGEVIAVFACGEDITDTIKLQDNFRIHCCDDYAVISTGEWSMKWDIHVERNDDRTVNRGKSYAYLADGKTKCVPSVTAMYPIKSSPGYFEGEVVEWVTDDKYQWKIPYPKPPPESNAIVEFAKAHLPFNFIVDDTQWAALYHCAERLVVDKRLADMQCFRCGETTFAFCVNGYDCSFQIGCLII
jgi:hypothetical protein